MPMPTPSTVNVPAAEQLPFINEAFRWTARTMTAPALITPALVKTFNSLSQQSLESLMAILEPWFDGRFIRTSYELDAITMSAMDDFREYFVIDPDHDDFTDDQLRVFLLIGADCRMDIDWRKIARMYNASAEKKALYDILFAFRPYGLDDLVNCGQNSLAPPQELMTTQTKEVDGETFVYCDIAKDWLRDDVFYRQFRISLFQTFVTDLETIVYSGTLEQAIAKATLYTLGKNGALLDKSGNPRYLDADTVKRNPMALTIYFYDGTKYSPVATASLIRNLQTLPESIISLDCKLQWGECRAHFDKKNFTKALYATEKMLGLQWSKVHNLEDALGL